jgi:hypothetical protein
MRSPCRKENGAASGPSRPPIVQDGPYLLLYPLSGFLSRDSGHQELVVGRVLVADRGDNGQRDRLGIQGPTGGAPPDPATAAGAGMLGDGLGPLGRAAWEQPAHLSGERRLECDVVLGPAFTAPEPLALTGVLVGQALLFRLGKGPFLHQQALTLVARERLKRTTTADKPLAFFARRVMAVSPAARNTR